MRIGCRMREYLCLIAIPQHAFCTTMRAYQLVSSLSSLHALQHQAALPILLLPPSLEAAQQYGQTSSSTARLPRLLLHLSPSRQ